MTITKSEKCGSTGEETVSKSPDLNPKEKADLPISAINLEMSPAGASEVCKVSLAKDKRKTVSSKNNLHLKEMEEFRQMHAKEANFLLPHIIDEPLCEKCQAIDEHSPLCEAEPKKNNLDSEDMEEFQKMHAEEAKVLMPHLKQPNHLDSQHNDCMLAHADNNGDNSVGPKAFDETSSTNQGTSRNTLTQSTEQIEPKDNVGHLESTEGKVTITRYLNEVVVTLPTNPNSPNSCNAAFRRPTFIYNAERVIRNINRQKQLTFSRGMCLTILLFICYIALILCKIFLN